MQETLDLTEQILGLDVLCKYWTSPVQTQKVQQTFASCDKNLNFSAFIFIKSVDSPLFIKTISLHSDESQLTPLKREDEMLFFMTPS